MQINHIRKVELVAETIKAEIVEVRELQDVVTIHCNRVHNSGLSPGAG